MLGEKIGGTSGKITARRVLPNLGGGPKMETSFQASGSILGADVKETGTYWSIVRQDGTFYAEGQGVMVTNDVEMATWTGHGTGVPTKEGGGRFPRSCLLPDYAFTLGATKQGRCRIRIRGGRRRQHALGFLGVEVVPAARSL